MKDKFKVQRPLGPGAERAPCFAYNQDRSVMLEVPMSQMQAIFKRLGNPLKFYCEATVEGDTLTFESLLPEQPW